jgi:PhnB protein
MPIKQATPYLFFSGNARTAIARYEKALGAKVLGEIMSYSQAPGAGPEGKDRVMHSMLEIGGGKVMLSDVPPGKEASSSSNCEVCLDFDDAAEMQRAFDELAKDAREKRAIEDTFWGAKFGTLTDVYGAHWMFNCDKR